MTPNTYKVLVSQISRVARLKLELTGPEVTDSDVCGNLCVDFLVSRVARPILGEK